MSNPLTVADALGVLQRSSLPTVITEGSDDYRVMRKIEKRLADIGVDFLPLSGKDMVLAVWSQIPAHRSTNTLALVDLDDWLYCGIPLQYQAPTLLYTVGYSIENDLLMDGGLEGILEAAEVASFQNDLAIVCADHAIQIERCKNGLPFELKRHAIQIINEGDKSPTLAVNECQTKTVLVEHYQQMLRGKTILQILVKQTNRPNRFAKLGYRQLYEIASMQPGRIFREFEERVRTHMTA